MRQLGPLDVSAGGYRDGEARPATAKV